MRWRGAAMLAGAAACAAYLFAERYYLRIVPVPLAAVGALYGEGGPAPAMTLRGRVDFPDVDITTREGLRAGLDFIRAMSPLQGGPPVDYAGVDFAGWLTQVRTRPMYCTDATALVMALAHRQGLPAREWWLWSSDGYARGDAHSIAEFWNPAAGRWQAVDGQTGTMLLLADGGPASYADFLAGRRIVYDRHPTVVALGAPALDTAHQLAAGRTPVLNMKPPRFFAATPRTDAVIGYAVMTGRSAHDWRIYGTKVAAVAMVVLGLAWWRARRRA